MKNGNRLCLMVATCALIASPVSASDDGGPPVMAPQEALALEAQSYADSYNVTFEEAIRRLALMHDASDNVREIERLAGDKLTGIFFDNRSDFSLVVNTAGPSGAIPATFRSKGRAFQQVPISGEARKRGLSEENVERARQIASQPQTGKVRRVANGKVGREQVQALRRANSQRNSSIEGYNGSTFDERTGELVILVFGNADQAKARAQAEALYPGVPIRFNVQEGMATDDHTRGGANLTQGCTTGFMVRDRTSNHVGVVSAGHCNFSTARYNAPDGSNYDMVRRQWNMNESLDLAFFWDDHATTGEFYPTSSATPRALVGWTSVSDTSETGYLTTGSYICHFGVYSGTQSCGEVTDKTFAPNISTGCGKPGATFVACGPYFVRVDKVAKEGQVALQCIGGDSGGPWFAYGNAYGINKGGYRTVSSDKNTCQYAFYTPIIKINDLNLTLWYGGTEVNGFAQ